MPTRRCPIIASFASGEGATRIWEAYNAMHERVWDPPEDLTEEEELEWFVATYPEDHQANCQEDLKRAKPLNLLTPEHADLPFMFWWGGSGYKRQVDLDEDTDDESEELSIGCPLFDPAGDLVRPLLAALNCSRPMLGSLLGRDGYLFDVFVWDLKPSEVHLDEDDLRLVFLEAHDKERQKMERLRRKFADEPEDVRKRPPIPESVRIHVWRRDGGQCVTCGSQLNLEFDHIIPFSRGGSSTERNIQLLCEECNRQKSDRI